MPEKKLTLVEHMEELRARVIKSVIFLIIVFAAFYNFVGSILPFLVKPVGKLVFIAPQEAFTSNIKIAFFGSLFLSSPFLLYQIWRFISDGLNPKERKYILIFAPISFILFALGAGFGYFIIVPIGVRFLLGFATDLILPMISMAKYISFVGMLTLAFAAIFELPLVMLFLTKTGVVTPVFFSSKRKHAVVLIFVAAAILTPPDVVTQLLMAFPLLFLFEVGIILSRLAFKKARK